MNIISVNGMCKSYKVVKRNSGFKNAIKSFFKREYKSSLLFFELTDDFKTNREAFSKYASHILEMLGKSH